jgi:predicted KAP-like P-loop ATPase
VVDVGVKINFKSFFNENISVSYKKMESQESSQNSIMDHSELIEQSIKDYCIDDTPIKFIAKDDFGRRPFAKRLIKVIKSRKSSDSIVFGIYGKWGEGKTTVLYYIEEGLKDNPDIICFKFNPWRYSDETSLILHFLNTLASKLEVPLSTKKEEIGKWLKNYSILATPVSALAGTDINEAVKNIGDQLSTVDVDVLKKRMEDILSSSNKRIVILIDDIDRLDKSEIQAIFRLVKLMGDFKYTTYVLAFDEKMVATALEEKYGSSGSKLKIKIEQDQVPQSSIPVQKKISVIGLSDEPVAGRNFIEKIVQIPLLLPKIDILSLRRYCFDQIIDLINNTKIDITLDQWQSFQREYVNGLEIRVKNGRIAKRYTNALLFALPALNGEVNASDLMIIEGIRVLYPELYEIIRENKDFFIDSSRQILRSDDEAKTYTLFIINEALKTYPHYEQDAGRNILKALFPRLIGVFGNTTHISDRLKNRKEKRICSGEYFDRYFIYGLLENDISDQEFSMFIETLGKGTLEKIFMNAQKFVHDNDSSLFLLKLKDIMPELNEESQTNLVILLSTLGDAFSTKRDFFGISPQSRAAYLIKDTLAKVVKKDVRDELALLVLETSPSVPFSCECFRVMVVINDTIDKDGLFTIEEEKKFGHIIVKRIKDYLEKEKQPIYLSKDAYGILYILANWGSIDDSNNYILKTFDRNKMNIDGTNVYECLKGFVNERYPAEEALPGDFTTDGYGFVRKIVRPDILIEELKKIYGDLNVFENKQDSSSFEEKIACQFIKLHTKKGNVDKNVQLVE